MSAPLPSNLDANQCIRGSFDESSGRLRVDAELTSTIIPTPGLEVSISAVDDNIAIRNSGNSNELLINNDGSININGSTTVSGTVDININGLDAFTTVQYTVGTSATQLTPSPLANRSSVSIKVMTTTNTDVVYIGTTSGVTTSTGYPLFNGDSVQLDLVASQTIYAIGTASGQRVFTLEIG